MTLRDPKVPAEARPAPLPGDSLQRYEALASKAYRTQRADCYRRAAEMGWRLGLLSSRDLAGLLRLLGR